MNRAQHYLTRFCIFVAVIMICGAFGKPEAVPIISMLAAALAAMWAALAMTIKE